MAHQEKIKKFVIASGAGATTLLMPASALAGNEIQEGADAAKPDGVTDDLQSSVTTITNTLLLVIGIVAVIMLIVGGFRYVLSGGNEKGTAAAKDTILYAIVGIIVALLAYAIVNFVIGRFS